MAEQEAQRYKQSVANVVDSLHAKTSGMGGSADVANRTAAAVAETAEQVHRLSLSPALQSLVEESQESEDARTLQLEEANEQLREQDDELKVQLAKLKQRL